MNTFLPYADFKKSAFVLDKQRLGKQRVEVLQLLRALQNPVHGYRNHPATKMWLGYTEALVAYGLAVCDEWTARGYKDTVYDQILEYMEGSIVLPLWFGRESFHASHRGNLLRKDRRWYSVFGWVESTFLPYEWPVNIPLEVLQELRRRGYEPISEGTSWPQATRLATDKPGVLVVGCHTLFYPCRIRASAHPQEGAIQSG